MPPNRMPDLISLASLFRREKAQCIRRQVRRGIDRP